MDMYLRETLSSLRAIPQSKLVYESLPLTSELIVSLGEHLVNQMTILDFKTVEHNIPLLYSSQPKLFFWDLYMLFHNHLQLYAKSDLIRTVTMKCLEVLKEKSNALQTYRRHHHFSSPVPLPSSSSSWTSPSSSSSSLASPPHHHQYASSVASSI